MNSYFKKVCMTVRTAWQMPVAASGLALLLCASPVLAQPALPGLCSVGKQSDNISFGTGGPIKAAECPASGHTRTALNYGTDPVNHKVDLYLPNNGIAPYPTVVWVHGGGWRNGDLTLVRQVERLLCRGFAVASINYRLTPQGHIFPAQIHDVKAAIRFLKSSTIASQFSLDTTRFALFGSSAGGHLTALAATSDTQLEDTSTGNAGVSSRVNAVVTWYPPTDFAAMDAQLVQQACIGPNQHPHSNPNSAESQLLGCTVGDANCADEVAAANPMTYVDANDPPMLVMHGTSDCNVPTQQGRSLHETRYNQFGACSTFRAVEGAGHGDSAAMPNFWVSTTVQDRTADFLAATLGTLGPRGSVSPATPNCSAFIVSGNPKSLNGATWTYDSTDGGVRYRLNGVLLAPASVSNPLDADVDGQIDLPGVVVSHGGGGAATGYSRTIGKSMATWGAVA
ncbi:MAG: alpha/beta hydrolase, partial [Phycisphaerae bacterium]|nr:alpha/beta hydrolase [Gemmatimonadaceae bacterium]